MGSPKLKSGLHGVCGDVSMAGKTLVALFMFTLLFGFLPTAKADGIGGCGPGSGSTIDTVCSGNVTELSGAWSGAVHVSLTNPFSLSPSDPAFVIFELGSPDVNADQFSFSFNTAAGSFRVKDITDNAYVLNGDIIGFTTGTDSITLSLLATKQTFYLAGSPCSTNDYAGCVLTAPPAGAAATSEITGEPTGRAIINYVGDPAVTSMTFDIPTSTPEPSSMLLFAIGLAGAGLAAFWRKRTADLGL